MDATTSTSSAKRLSCATAHGTSGVPTTLLNQVRRGDCHWEGSPECRLGFPATSTFCQQESPSERLELGKGEDESKKPDAGRIAEGERKVGREGFS